MNDILKKYDSHQLSQIKLRLSLIRKCFSLEGSGFYIKVFYLYTHVPHGDCQTEEATTSRHIYQEPVPTMNMPPLNLHPLKAPVGRRHSRRQKRINLTCFSGSNMNSSVLDTSTKCCRTYLWADLSRSLQECVSAKPRMPRQLEGSSWLRRNLQQASRTPLSCSRLAAGSNV